MRHDDPMLLRNQLCFALYAATHAMTRAYRGRLGRVGLTYPQYLAMLVLWEQDRQPMKQLSQTLGLDSGTLTPLLKRLEKAGLVRRQRSADDERVVVISLTDAGSALRQQVAELQREVVCDTGLDPATFAELRGQLQRLAETMTEAQNAESVA